MNWGRLITLIVIGIGTFAVIALGAFVLITLYAPTRSTYSFVGFIGTMFAVTGAVITVVIVATRRIFL